MRHHPDLMTHLQRAEEHVRNARQSWDATDMERCVACVEHLQEAAAALQSAQQFTAEPQHAATNRERIERLQISVKRLGRMVDAAIAFHRGLALQTGMDEAVITKGNG